MEFFKPTRLLNAMAATVMLTLAMSSCSKSGELADNVPADAIVVVKLNLQQVIENAGCTVENGRISLSPELTDEIGKDDPSSAMIINQFLSYTEGLDLSEAIFFVRERNDREKGVVMAVMTDKDKVAQTLGSFLGKPESKDGFECYDVSGNIIALKENILYFSDNLNIITDALNKAEKENLSSMPGLQKFLAEDNALAIIVSGKKIDLPSAYRNQWICGSLKFNGPEVSGELCMMDTDGNRNPFGEAFGELSSDFLRYIPDNTQLVAAIGPVKEPSLKQQINSYARQMGTSGKYLTDLDGTASFALHASDSLLGLGGMQFWNRFNGSNFDWSLIDMIAMAHYPETTADALVTELKDMFMLQGQTVETTDDGLSTFTIDNLRGFFGNVDNYFAIANFPIKASSGNRFNVNLDGKRAIIYSISKPTKETAELFGANIGSEGGIWLEKDCIKGKVSLTGTDSKYLQTVIRILLNPKMQELIETCINEMMGSTCYYDYYDDYDYPDDVEMMTENIAVSEPASF